MNWTLLLTISLALLAGCASQETQQPLPKPVVVTKYVVPDCDNPPARAPVEFRVITWRVLQTADGEFFALSVGEYADLGWNTSETIKGARELRAEIKYYIDCIDKERQAAAQKNAEVIQ